MCKLVQQNGLKLAGAETLLQVLRHQNNGSEQSANRRAVRTARDL